MFYFFARFRSGDELVFTKIYSKFKRPVFRYISMRVGDLAVAEEITQDVFLKVYRFREQYDPTRAFSSWLWTIARNTIADWGRGRELIQAEGCPDELPALEDCVETKLIRKSDRKNLMRLGRKLTHQQKRVLWLRFVHHFSYDEIATKLGLSLSAVKSLIYRAKTTLSEA